MSERQEPGTYKGRISGLRWEAEACPDARGEDTLKNAAIGGGVGYLSAILLGVSPQLRLVVAGLGALAGHVATKYHLNLDWDPDQLRGDEPPPPAPRDDDDFDPRPQPL